MFLLLEGRSISTDNTCRAKTELKAFFEGGGVSELEAYKSVLEFHISLLEEAHSQRRTKEQRLAQINIYLEALVDMRYSYPATVNALLSQPSNLYSMQLRPSARDQASHVVNPVFTINRNNNGTRVPLSPLYNTDFHRPFKPNNLPLTKFEHL